MKYLHFFAIALCFVAFASPVKAQVTANVLYRVFMIKYKNSTGTAFSIDVDDRLTGSDLGQIRVTGGEMAGAAAIFETTDGRRTKAVFDTQNRAQVCP
jgi:hypothetical protein